MRHMTSSSDSIIAEISRSPGIADSALAQSIYGPGAPQQRVNGECRRLAARGLISRRNRKDGLIGNYPSDGIIRAQAPMAKTPLEGVIPIHSEDEVKKCLIVRHGGD
jgi:hypothetical protein